MLATIAIVASGVAGTIGADVQPEAASAAAPYDAPLVAAFTNSNSIYDANVSPDGTWRIVMLYGGSPAASQLYRSQNHGVWTQVPMPSGVSSTSQVAIDNSGVVMIEHATGGQSSSPTNFFRYSAGNWTAGVQFGGGCSPWTCASNQGPAQLDISSTGMLLTYDGAGRVFFSNDGGIVWSYGGAFATQPGLGQFSVSSTFTANTWVAAATTSTLTGGLLVWSLATHAPASENTTNALSDPHNYVRAVTRDPNTDTVWATSTHDGLTAFSTNGSAWAPEATYRLPLVPAGTGGGYAFAYAAPGGTLKLVADVASGPTRSYYTTTVTANATGTPSAWGQVFREDVSSAGFSQVMVLQGASDATGAHAERFISNGGTFYEVGAGGAAMPTLPVGATLDGIDQSTPIVTTQGDPNGTLEAARSPLGHWQILYTTSLGTTNWYRVHDGGPLEPLANLTRANTGEVTVDDNGTVTMLTRGDGTFDVRYLQFQSYANRPDWFGPRVMTTCFTSFNCDVTSPGDSPTSLVHYGVQTLAMTQGNGTVYLSTDYGITWAAKPGIGVLYTNTQVIWPGGPYIYYAGGNVPSNTFRRFNLVSGTADPATTPPPPGGTLVLNMAEPGDPNELWMVYPTTGGVVAYKSIDRGSNWSLAIGTDNGTSISGEPLPAGSPSTIRVASMDTSRRLHLYGMTTCTGNLSITDVVRDTTTSGPGVLTQLAVIPSNGTPVTGTMNQDYFGSPSSSVWARFSLDGDSTTQYIAHLQRPGVGVQTTFGFDSYGPVAGSVNTASGNFTQNVTDTSIAAVGPPLSIARTYNSLDGRTGLFGKGWSSALDMRVVSNCPVNAATLIRPNGRWEVHSYSNGTYTPPQGYKSTLATAGAGWQLNDGDGTVTVFNASGRPTSITDTRGHTQTIAYDGSGRASVVTDVVTGHTLTLSYTAASTVVASVTTQPVTIGVVTAPLTWSYTYTSNRLTGVASPGGASTTYSCNARGLLSAGTDNTNQPFFGVTYTSTGKAAVVTDGTAGVSTYNYTTPTQTSVSDALNHGITFNYDSQYRTTSVVDPDGVTFTYSYDSGTALRGTISGPHGVISSQTTNAAGLPDTTTDSGGHVTTYTYDNWGNTLTVTDPRGVGYTTGNTWDGPHHLKLTTSSPPTPDQPAGIQHVWTYTTGVEAAYGSGGTVPAYLLRTESDGRGIVTTYSYDSSGNITRIVSPSGLDSRFTYDQLGRTLTQTDYSDTYPSGVVVRSIAYAANGSEATITGPAFVDAVTPTIVRQERTTNTFDNRGRIATQTLSDVGGSASPTPSRTTGFTYDNAGRMLTVTDARNKTTTNTYDAAGNLATTTDRLGHVIAYTYNSANKLASIVAKGFVDPANPAAPRDITLETRIYNDLGQLASKTDARGVQTTYTYFAGGQPQTVTIHNVTASHDITTSYTYDAAGNPLTQIVGTQQQTTYTYDALNRVTSNTLEMGTLADRTQTYNYDADDNIVTARLTDGTVTSEQRYAYDTAGRRYQFVTENGATDLTSSATYDQRGLVASSTSPRGNTTNYTYDQAGHLTTALLAQVRITDQVNDNVLARPTSKASYNAYGEAIANVDANGNKTTKTLDVLGHVTRIDYPSYTQPSTATLISPYETVTYDDNGNALTNTRRNGTTWTTTYDTLGRVAIVTDPTIAPNPAGVTRFSRDDMGNVTSVVDQLGGFSNFTYDGLGRQLTDTRVVRTTGAPRNETLTRTYDDIGDVVSITNELGKQTVMTYDNAGEMLTATAPGSSVTTNTYNALGNVVTVSDPVGRKTEITYDLAGRATSSVHKSPAGVVLTTATGTYDADGNLVTAVSPLGNTSGNTPANYTTTYTYDAAGRLTNVSLPATASATIATQYRYDSVGNETKVIDPRGNTTVYTYNSMNLPESVIEPSTTLHTNAVDRTWTGSYNAAAQLITYKGPNALTVARAYDANGNTTTETSTATGQTTVNKSFTYDPGSNLTSFTGAAGTAVTATWDDARRLTALAGQTYNNSSFTYDLAGQLASRTDATGTANVTWTDRGRPSTMTDPLTGATRTWTYFADDRPNTAATTSGANTTTNLYTWDDLGRLSTDVLKVGTTVLSSVTEGYDNNSNLTSKTTVLTGNSGAGTNTFNYDFAGRLTSWTKGTTTTAYAYDLAGNRTSAAGVISVYDQRNRLTSTGANTTYTYNALGQRTSTVISGKGGSTTTYAYDAAGRTTSVAGTTYTYDPFDRVTQAGTAPFAYSGLSDNPVKATGGTLYSYDPTGSIVSTKTGTTAALVDTDPHNDVAALYTTSGTLSATASYDPWGTVTVATGTLGPLGFQSDLTQSGNVWMAARWYQPGTASFTARDTYNGDPTLPSSLNRYAYASSSPLIYSDPSGHLTAPAGATDGSTWKPIPKADPCTGGSKADVNFCDNIITGDELDAAPEAIGDYLNGILRSNASQLDDIGTAVLKQALSMGVSLIPGVGEAYMLYSGVVGHDPITGANYSGWQRAICIAPVVVRALGATGIVKSARAADNGAQELTAALTSDNTGAVTAARGFETGGLEGSQALVHLDDLPGTAALDPAQAPALSEVVSHGMLDSVANEVSGEAALQSISTSAGSAEATNSFIERATGGATKAADIPGTIYRGGGSSPSNLKMRPGEDALSFRDSLSNPLEPGSPVLHPGRDYIGIDTSKLPPGSVVPDGVPGSALTPPGHVSVYVTDPDVLKAAIIEKGKFLK